MVAYPPGVVTVHRGWDAQPKKSVTALNSVASELREDSDKKCGEGQSYEYDDQGRGFLSEGAAICSDRAAFVRLDIL